MYGNPTKFKIKSSDIVEMHDFNESISFYHAQEQSNGFNTWEPHISHHIFNLWLCDIYQQS